ncbi:hypothetical protein J6590_096239 [Homalodisca vitripennis]|nr:hypothetical protein J6590_096239 [Homalodisca vitripennis]
MCHLNLGNLMDVQERHITNRRQCRDIGVQGQFDRSSLLREMTVGVGGVGSLSIRGWFRAGLPFFRGDMTLRLVPYFFLVNLDRGRPLPRNLTEPEYPVTMEAALRNCSSRPYPLIYPVIPDTYAIEVPVKKDNVVALALVTLTPHGNGFSCDVDLRVLDVGACRHSLHHILPL